MRRWLFLLVLMCFGVRWCCGFEMMVLGWFCWVICDDVLCLVVEVVLIFFGGELCMVVVEDGEFVEVWVCIIEVEVYYG